MKDSGFEQADRLVTAMFVVILSTVFIAGVLARPLGRLLGLVQEHPQGILFLGTERLTRVIAAAVKEAGIPVLLLENDWSKASSARLEGLPVYFGDALSARITEDIDLGNFGRLCAVSSNSELNALVCVRFRRVFGADNVYQLPLPSAGQGKRTEIRERERGRYLFREDASFSQIELYYGADPTIKTTAFSPEFDFESFRNMHGSEALPLFLLPAAGRIEPITSDMTVSPIAGQILISLVRRG